MRQHLFTVWFRAYVFIPVLAVLYVVIPLFVWNFSPHALTHTVPQFLLGATDWGSGNIYTFTKIAYWLALVLGTVANASVCSQVEGLAKSFWWRIRLNLWHIGAAFVIPLSTILGGINTDTIDMWLLFAYFFTCTALIVLLLTAGEKKSGWKAISLPLSLLLAVLWGFVPVAIGRP
jgi:hypothetical protein